MHPDLYNTFGLNSIKDPYKIVGFLINYTAIILGASRKHKAPYPNLIKVVL